MKTGSGLHLHHLVWGIVLMMLVGFLGFAFDQQSPRTEILAALFGIGVGLTLDEFALWIHPRDVYSSEEGRASFDAVVVVTVIGGLIVLGTVPFDVPNNTSSVETLLTAIVLDVLLAAVAIVKGKRLLALIGIFLPLVSLIGAVRLASPTSLWARRFYPPDGRRLARARARWGRIEARRRRVADAIAGAQEPSSEPTPTPGEAVDRELAGNE